METLAFLMLTMAVVCMFIAILVWVGAVAWVIWRYVRRVRRVRELRRRV